MWGVRQLVPSFIALRHLLRWSNTRNVCSDTIGVTSLACVLSGSVALYGSLKHGIIRLIMQPRAGEGSHDHHYHRMAQHMLDYLVHFSLPYKIKLYLDIIIINPVCDVVTIVPNKCPPSFFAFCEGQCIRELSLSLVSFFSWILYSPSGPWPTFVPLSLRVCM